MTESRKHNALSGNTASGRMGPGGGGGEREVLLTIKKRLKVGKHNALSGNTASGRSGSSI
jgi:hypothetical protein